MKNNRSNHDEEHAQWDRRGFLKTLGVAGGGIISFGSSSLSVVNSNLLNIALNDAKSDRILVLIRLKGGNDGLNTIVPIYDFDIYANKRPNIYIPENKLIKLNDDFGIPGYMSSFEGLWKDGGMKVVHGVGYDDQNLSHFKSSEIWATTTKDSNMTSGWLGRYYEDKYNDYLVNPPKKPLAIQVGSGGDIIFDGDEVLDIRLPAHIILEVLDTEPGFKGNTATGASKPATVETGFEINVPLFIEKNDKIKVITKNNEKTDTINVLI